MHEREIRKEGFPQYAVQPAGERALYTSIIYLEPFSGRNLRAFGYDMFAEPKRRKAMEVARDSDNATSREILTGRMVSWGMRPSEVQDGPAALQTLNRAIDENDPFRIAVIDMQMPEMDGIEATRRIRNPKSAIANHHIPIIAMTANAMQGDRERCLDAGMDDYVSKPVSPQALVEALDKWLPEVPPPAIDRATRGSEGTTSSSAQESNAQIFDRAGMMGRLMNDAEIVGMVVEGFLEDMPQQIAALHRYQESGDIAGVQRQGHTIRGASSNVGGNILCAVAHEIEKAGKAGDLAAARARMSDLQGQFERLRQAMREEFQGTGQ